MKPIILFLSFFFAAGSFAACANAEETKSEKAQKGLSIKLGYLDQAAVSCKCAKHCREDLAPVERGYMQYLDEGAAQVTEAVNSGASAETVQEKLQNYRDGLSARETLYGRCPGKCLSYSFPVELRNASRLAARSARVDFLVDIAAVYYGAELVLKGANLSEPILTELNKGAR